MTAPRTPLFQRLKTCALYAAVVLPCSFAAPQVFADFQASSNLTDTFGGLSTEKTTEAATSNISALQKQLNAINTEINAGGTTDEIAQLRAVANALEDIIAKLKAGYTITDYGLTTDAATLAATIRMAFTGRDGSIVILKFEIPGISADLDTPTSPEDGSSSGSSSSGGSSDSPDLLTQILQQLGSQMGGGQNPMGNIQGMLNGLMSGTANPVQALSGAVEEAAASAMQCKLDGSKATNGNGVAVYDISAGKVYMPNGDVLEAHSGLGAMMDNPAYVNQRMRGPTPPNVYNLSMRESRFYGVEAIRLTPTDAGSMYGRDGILAHTPLRRGTVGSSGCIAFQNYDAFLNAFKRGEVKQVVVVPSVAEGNKKCSAPMYNTPSPGASSKTPTR